MNGLNSDTPDNDENQEIVPDACAISTAVRFNEGPLKGFEGIIVDRRESGRYLIQIHKGVYVEASLVEFTPSEAS